MWEQEKPAERNPGGPYMHLNMKDHNAKQLRKLVVYVSTH